MRVKPLVAGVKPHENLMAGVILTMFIQARREIAQQLDELELAHEGNSTPTPDPHTYAGMLLDYISGVPELDIRWVLIGAHNMNTLRTYTTQIKIQASQRDAYAIESDVVKILAAKLGLDATVARRLFAVCLSRLANMSVRLITRKSFYLHSSHKLAVKWDTPNFTIVQFKD